MAGVHRDYGLLKKKLGDEKVAREHLEKALAMYEKMGGTINIEKIRKALNEVGSPPGPKGSKGPK
jgi:hypothetical protein